MNKRLALILRTSALAIALIAMLFAAINFYRFSGIDLSQPESIEGSVSKAGIWAPLLLISLHVLQNISLFIPGPFISIAGGYVFGPWLGFIYNLIGSTIGIAALFLLSRSLGRKWVQNTVPADYIDRFEKYFEAHKGMFLIYVRVIPLSPGEIITMITSMTKIPFWTFMLYTTLGNIPRLLVENLFGGELRRGVMSYTLIIITAAMVVLFIITVFHRELSEHIHIRFIKKKSASNNKKEQATRTKTDE